MKLKHAYRWAPCPAYDIEGTESWLESLASEGLMLTEDGFYLGIGVFDRIELVKDKETTQSPEIRPQYVYQVPLTFIPGVGGKTIDKLLNAFETEMNILHKLSKDDIEGVVGEKVANTIERARTGGMTVHSGGGGNYGKIE